MALGPTAITALLEPTVVGLGFALWGVEYRVQGRVSTLRVYIDAAQGITVEDCARVSHQISGVLDVEDPIPGEYQLEVSSPGLDRPLFKPEQYSHYVGQMIALRLKAPLQGRQQLKGVLLAVADRDVKLQANEEVWTVSFEQIKKAHVIPVF